MKKFYVGIKAIVHDKDRGYLLLKHNKGHWDIPGGRMDDGEEFKDTIEREFSEEIPGTELLDIGDLQGTFRLPHDIDGDMGLILLYFVVTAKTPGVLVVGDEHSEFLWINSGSDIPDEDVNPEMKKILYKLLE